MTEHVASNADRILQQEQSGPKAEQPRRKPAAAPEQATKAEPKRKSQPKPITVPFAGIAKQFWPVVAEGTEVILQKVQVEYSLDRKAMTFTLTDRPIAQGLPAIWADANRAFHDWKRGNEGYWELRKKGLANITQMERDFFRDFLAGVAAHISREPLPADATEATAAGHREAGEDAALAPLRSTP